jgi:hypothetical protein
MKSLSEKIVAGTIGICETLRFSQVPAGAEAHMNQPVKGAVLTVAGDYYADVDVQGLVTELEIHLKSTLTSGTCVSDAYATFIDGTTKKGASATGVGALASATIQSSSLAMTDHPGVRNVRVKLTVAGGTPNQTVTQAEVNGI